MVNRQLKNLVYSALLLALAIATQNLRLVLPLPPFISMFIIGSLVNMLLLLNARIAGIKYAAAASLILAGVAFLQGQLPIIFMIPVVAVGNILLAAWGTYFWRSRLIWVAPVIKAAFLGAATLFLLSLLELPPQIGSALLMMMSWPQVITGLCGIMLAKIIWRRLNLP